MIDERVTPSFWLSEFIRSDTATRMGIDNSPPPGVMSQIRAYLAPGMQRIRDLLCAPVQITSGYRCPALNDALHGTANSQHMLGQAADFICPQFGPPLKIAHFILDHSAIRFDQLIYEGTWVHVSFGPQERHQVLTATFVNGVAQYRDGLPG